jgi:beta-galactosidase beta subunit
MAKQDSVREIFRYQWRRSNVHDLDINNLPERQYLEEISGKVLAILKEIFSNSLQNQAVDPANGQPTSHCHKVDYDFWVNSTNRAGVRVHRLRIYLQEDYLAESDLKALRKICDIMDQQLPPGSWKVRRYKDFTGFWVKDKFHKIPTKVLVIQSYYKSKRITRPVADSGSSIEKFLKQTFGDHVHPEFVFVKWSDLRLRQDALPEIHRCKHFLREAVKACARDDIEFRFRTTCDIGGGDYAARFQILFEGDDLPEVLLSTLESEAVNLQVIAHYVYLTESVAGGRIRNCITIKIPYINYDNYVGPHA